MKRDKTYEFKTWASTTADSDFALASGEKSREHHPERQIVMFEVVTKRGMPLHNPDDRFDSLQSKEREVLLAPGERYKVVGVQRDVLYRDSRNLSISERLGGMEVAQGRYHVVQLEAVSSPPSPPSVAAESSSPQPLRPAQLQSNPLRPSPQQRMTNARNELRKRMMDARMGSPEMRNEQVAEIFDRAQHEISRIKNKEDAEKLFSHYERQHLDVQLNTDPRDNAGQAVVAAYRDVSLAMRDMVGR